MNEQKSLRDQFANWCRHFNGVGNDRCEIGVIYDIVRDPGTRGLPCLKEHGCSDRCARASFLTEQELDVKVAHEEAIIGKFLDEMLAGTVCIVCRKPITARKQIGRCVYSQCGHRQYQGTLPKGEEK